MGSLKEKEPKSLFPNFAFSGKLIKGASQPQPRKEEDSKSWYSAKERQNWRIDIWDTDYNSDNWEPEFRQSFLPDN